MSDKNKHMRQVNMNTLYPQMMEELIAGGKSCYVKIEYQQFYTSSSVWVGNFIYIHGTNRVFYSNNPDLERFFASEYKSFAMNCDPVSLCNSRVISYKISKNEINVTSSRESYCVVIDSYGNYKEITIWEVTAKIYGNLYSTLLFTSTLDNSQFRNYFPETGESNYLGHCLNYTESVGIATTPERAKELALSKIPELIAEREENMKKYAEHIQKLKSIQ